MKKRTILGMAAAAAGTAGWVLAANRRKSQVEVVRREAWRLLKVRRDELEALRAAAEVGELAADALGPVPLDGARLDGIRLEDGVLTITLSSRDAIAWLSNRPLEELDVPNQPWRGKARPGVLYTESLGDGWYSGCACRRWG